MEQEEKVYQIEKNKKNRILTLLQKSKKLDNYDVVKMYLLYQSVATTNV